VNAAFVGIFNAAQQCVTAMLFERPGGLDWPGPALHGDFLGI
jgi:hypothetical protein